MWVAVSAQPVPPPSPDPGAAHVPAISGRPRSHCQRDGAAQSDVGTQQQPAACPKVTGQLPTAPDAGPAVPAGSKLHASTRPQPVRTDTSAAGRPLAAPRVARTSVNASVGPPDKQVEAAGQRQRPKPRRGPPVTLAVIDDRAADRSSVPAVEILPHAPTPIYDRAAAVLGNGGNQAPAARRSSAMPATEGPSDGPATDELQQGAAGRPELPVSRAAGALAEGRTADRQLLSGPELVPGPHEPVGRSLPFSCSESESQPKAVPGGGRDGRRQPESTTAAPTIGANDGMRPHLAGQEAALKVATLSLGDAQAVLASAGEAEALQVQEPDVDATEAARSRSADGVSNSQCNDAVAAATTAQDAAPPPLSSPAAAADLEVSFRHMNKATAPAPEHDAAATHHRQKRRRSTAIGVDFPAGEHIDSLSRVISLLLTAVAPHACSWLPWSIDAAASCRHSGWQRECLTSPVH